MSNANTIICPNCGTQIDIDTVLFAQVESRIKQEYTKKYESMLEAERSKLNLKTQELERKRAEIEAQQAAFDTKLQQALHEKLKEYREALRREVADEQRDAMEQMRKELEEKSRQVRELNAAKIEIERLKRDKDEAIQKAKLEAEQALNVRLQEEKKKLEELVRLQTQQKLKEFEEIQALKLKEKEEQLEQLKRALEDAKRKSEQGSMQLQGEAMELMIEEWLRTQFPFDTVEEVKKGAFGADCIQRVHTRQGESCGVIVYESKQTKAWNDAWISKLKEDMLRAGADIGVLVTSVYPKGMERMGWVDGIWVCSLEEFKGSAALLRESLVRLHTQLKKEENKSDKMTLLYNYLTGNEFQMQLRAIVEGFMKMQEELDKEKRSLMAAWKRRQKLIDGVLTHTTEMYGALQGIAGSGAIAHIEALELPYESDKRLEE